MFGKGKNEKKQRFPCLGKAKMRKNNVSLVWERQKWEKTTFPLFGKGRNGKKQRFPYLGKAEMGKNNVPLVWERQK
ncbi:hypothetical protein AS203_06175 [Hoylesella enoeca]|uniref:Uncharacterized protein n=2 Tax=Hoylesella enoeca TaxID=76123 RepID=A0A0S2KK88_9BACT|nr:hypothetical protein AS203_06175 [Hoylesella enoeca]